MTNKTRLKKIEQASGAANEKKKYHCILSPYSTEGGKYKAQAWDGSADLYFDTLAELEAFGKRADIELLTISILYASKDLGNDVQTELHGKGKKDDE